MKLATAFLLALSLATPPACASVEWLSNLEEAKASASRSQQPLLVHLRGQCGRCNRHLDELLEAAATHEPVVRAYGSFVLCRLEPGFDLTQIDMFSDESMRRPSIVLLSPRGMYLMSTDAKDLNQYMSFLNAIRREEPRISSVDALVAADRRTAAQMAAGRIALAAAEYDRAKLLLKRARAEFEAAGDGQNAEMAWIEEKFAQLSSPGDPRSRDGALRELLATANSTKFRANAAEIYLRLGLASRDQETAAGDLRRAFENAEPGSESWAKAGRWLADRGLVALKNQEARKPTIRIIRPDRATVTGRIELTAECAPAVARVAWLQDGTPVASDSSPPFTAALHLGTTPRLHVVQALAFDRMGYAIGQTQITVNDRLDAFSISIVAPVAAVLSGPVVVEAEAQAPPGSKITSVALLWNDREIARMTAPPYRARFDVPQDFGFIRAVATLDDGRIAEETKPVNEGAFSMPVNVHDIVFPVTVVDRKGPVSGLRAEDFVVTDEGSRVPVALQRDEGSTLGLAIDASSSMNRSLLDVMEMSAEIIEAAVTPVDKAFLMAFDERPYLLQMAASDSAKLKAAAFDVTPAGMTSLFDAIAFALQQFTGMPGRRALLVLTDGLEIASSQSGGSCARMAREMGVPVYIIVTRTRPAQPKPTYAQNLPLAQQTRLWTAAAPGSYESSLDAIASETGGGIFFAPRADQQRTIFTRIRDELRGQYLLVFAAPDAKPGSWRRIAVEVPKVRGSVRTVAGYYAR